MKIFSTAPEGNELAQYVGVDYIKFAISTIEGVIDWMKKNDNVAQPLLANIDLLLVFAKKYTTDANLLLEKKKIQEWKAVFNDWFSRCESKIPAKYKDGIKQNGDELFSKLEQYGH
ncbi:hypothetical protein C1637_23990 [Chryseobacterium lactis]|uniref:Uncharacterized protein n=1 Tax=Chryseobacterium lactis TaxID=1241981 RepID=A0A3G6RKC5_CHRLC|nr:hypothetical protein [Chryseobacterium lactis]AZA83264.1 hypothetical protein EG342_15880 [Chryseobacterium lactis]AZB03649.1 hypothetical protein EG341_06750 [Chryseobacterium lactis]PNW11141.1 hypothetical protein C1637_23990 [Chryseobacterium lactis]